jgi:pilus assembly protein Flp/PilA
VSGRPDNRSKPQGRINPDPDRFGGHTRKEPPMLNPFATLVTLVSFAQDRLKREEKGATAVEYGLMVGLIAVVIIAAVTLLGQDLLALFNQITAAL